MPLDRNEVEPVRPRRIVAPRAPRREEIDAEAEPVLEDDELAAVALSFEAAGPPEKDMARLAQRAIAARVDVAVALARRRAMRVERQRDGLDGHAGQVRVSGL